MMEKANWLREFKASANHGTSEGVAVNVSKPVRFIESIIITFLNLKRKNKLEVIAPCYGEMHDIAIRAYDLEQEMDSEIGSQDVMRIVKR